MRSLWQDVRYGLRVLARNPGFTAIAVLTLALGIGANTALFSVVSGVLLHPLRFPAPDQLQSVYTRTEQFSTGAVSYPNFLDWQRDNRAFSALGAYRSDDFNLTGSGEAERLRACMVSAEFFPLLGVRPMVGRTFTTNEDRAGAGPVAVLADGLWKRKFAGAADIAGKTITLNGKLYTIVGVAPGRLTVSDDADVYVPIGQWTDETFLDRRASMGMRVVGRLKPGVTATHAQADMDRIAKDLANAYPEADKGAGINVVPLKKDVVGNVEGILLVLLGAVGFVLLIACANVANLLLARATGRSREFAVRAALGANAWRIVRQLLTESVLLALCGGLLGAVLAKWGTRAILAALPDALPRSEEIGLDGGVLLFTLGISALTGVLFGLAPALRLLRPDLQETLKAGGRGSSGARQRTQSIFVAAEIGMALVLLIGAGLMIRSLRALWAVDPGFDPRHAVAFSMSLTPGQARTPAALRAKYRESLRAFESVRGVSHVSLLGGSLPMSGDSEVPFGREDRPRPENLNDMPETLFYLVTPGYLPAMGIPLRAGRFLTDRDDERAPSVAVIDEAFARKHFPGENPIGKRVHLALLDMNAEIVGVAGHVEHWGLGNAEHQSLQEEIYVPLFQLPDKFWSLIANGAGFVARTEGASLDVASGIRQAASRFDASAAIYQFRPLEEVVAGSIARQRMAMILLSILSALALALSAIGVYGVIAYLAAQRTREIGVRMALGATRRDVLGLVLGQGMKIALAGIAAGIVAALWLTRLLAKMIYGVDTTDPVTFGSVALLLTAVALLACYVPARRAMSIDPTSALRCE
ncbi:MAG TPA: ABC transporter permease [Thermoanaerobaculia bacterium]|nr:ABC transporter permease [Thermoanaerobaculia bacterium]